MKRRGILAGMVAVGLLAGPALAAAPTAAQQAEFYKICMGIASDDRLCSCKAEAAVKLLDKDFMDVVIGGMKGKPPPPGDAYAVYIGKSNAICIPGY